MNKTQAARCAVRLAAGTVLVFGAAAFFNVLLLLFFPLRKKIGPLLVQLLSGAFLLLAGVRIQSFGRAKVADPVRPTLILANHVSFLDIVVLSAVYRSVFVSKQEVRLWPFIGTLGIFSGVVFLDRSRMSRRIFLLKHLAEHLTPGSVTVVFPQGTTSSRIENRPFSRGIFKVVELNPAVRLQPVTLDYENESQIAWCDETFRQQVRRILSLRRIAVRVTAHPTVGIGTYRKKTVREVSAKVERTVKAPLDPISPYKNRLN